MSVIIIVGIIWGICKLISAASVAAKERAAERERERIRAEQTRIREEQARARAWQREQEQRAREAARRQAEQERAIAKAAKEREALRKEQERQAAQLAKHEEMIRKLEIRMASAESELAFNREQRERLFKLLDIEERERDAAIEGSRTWQAHHKKVISLENQIHTVQKRIDKAHMDKAYCESKLSA